MEVNRYDFAQFKATKTDEGFLVDTPIVGRVGIQTYLNADGTTRKEYRPADEVFNVDALASMVGKPITDAHPKGKVTSANFKKLTIGTILGAGKQDGNNVRADIIIQDAEAILKAEKGGVRELSLGYTVDLEEIPGIFNGEHYDAIQRNIRVNHLAIVPKGRAGNARLNLDRNDAVVITEDVMSEKLGRVRLDSGIEYDAALEVVHALDKLRDDAAIFKTNVETANGQIEKLAGERDTLKARVDGFAAELDKVKADALQAAHADVKARAELDKAAEGCKVDTAGKSDREVKEAVIKSVRADADLTGKSDEYVNAAFDMSVSMKVDSAMAGQRKQVLNADGANTAKTSAEKYQEYKKSLSTKGA
ncbi:Uncharacterised conserved protein UCP029215 [uncultured Caudovirales phage]|uniref:Uncharacterized conserved protein UCP029215 n=1 Tax=uncultured Caudovirales phage TaxID=2100421 RepID=A0A6J5RV42_9CAUD|nr:Uncharacterised conserved protein UCP029215 [uncultured Caudovirales phage]